MANDHALHRCFTNFMLDTCFLGRETVSQAWILCFSFGMTKAYVNADNETFYSGSSAEFYIKPLLPCIGDIDIMQSFTSCIAIPAGHRPPTKLPDHYQPVVTAYEIVNSHKPGYVYLQPSYSLKKDDSNNYVAMKNENTSTAGGSLLKAIDHMPGAEPFKKSIMDFLLRQLFQNYHNSHNLLQSMTHMIDYRCHGPAITNAMRTAFEHICHTMGLSQDDIAYIEDDMNINIVTNFDIVDCMRCFLWPPQASNWPKRYRHHGWPYTATIKLIVSNGCDMVQAEHPSCRQETKMVGHQWRLSFSRAEVTLLNSWTPVQQIIYHMLRFVAKYGGLSEMSDSCSDSPKLSNYHIKTLMLWQCEQKPQSWWSAESSLVKLCSSLLHKLSDLVQNKHCRHYFVNNCNLLDHFDDESLVIWGWLSSMADVGVLLHWFIENYMRKSAHCCSYKVLALFKYARYNNELDRVTQAIVDWKLSTVPHGVLQKRSFEEMRMHRLMRMYGPCSHPKWTSAIVTELQLVDLHIRDYFVAVASLQIAYTVSIHSLTPDILEALWSLLGFSTTLALHDSDVVGGVLCIRKAIKLARCVSLRSNALEMLHNEVAKAYLHNTFTYKQEAVYYVVHVLLAALYCKSGNYQEAKNHCKKALMNYSSQGLRLRRFEAEYLPQIDDNINAVLGLLLLYQHFQRNALNVDEESQTERKLTFTTELLLHYLQSKCASQDNSISSEINVYRQRLLQTKQPFIGDVLLFKTMDTQLNKNTTTTVRNIVADNCVNDCAGSMDTKLLVTTLELVSLEKLIAVRQLTVREVYSKQFPVVNEFEILYAYKCGLYENCLEMCRNNVNILHRFNHWRLQKYRILFPGLLSLIEGELVSLFGIIRLMQPPLIIFLFHNPAYLYISFLTLFLYLMAQCQKKLGRLDDTMQWLRFVHDKVIFADDEYYVLDQFILKLTYRSLKLHFSDVLRRNAYRST